jgi:uncharacterized protein (DUF433 family)
MPEALAIERVPLIAGDDGVIRIEGTRIPLETIIAAFQEGCTAEEISQQYPSVPLGVVYQVVGYYLGHRSELDTYIANREAVHAYVRNLNESRWPSTGIRERLLARRKS